MDSQLGAASQARLLGVKIDDLASDEVVGKIISVIGSASRMIVSNVNVYALNLAFEQPWLRSFFNNSEIVFCDGFGVKWGAALVGQRIDHRISPPDWIDLLAREAAQRKLTFYLLGGQEGVALEAGRRLVEKHPGLRLAGCASGYFDRRQAGPENRAVVAQINRARPDILVIGMGMPIQERWLEENWGGLEAKVAITAGALLDYMAGVKQRPPKVLTDHGLEWLGRMFYEPGRLWRRYLIGNPLFMWRVVLERFGVLKLDDRRKHET